MSKYNGKKVGEVFETKDYSMFKTHPENRDIINSHVNTLAKKMKDRGWLKTSVVTINEKHQVIDGQHRVRAAQIAGVPIRYVIVTGAAADEIISMNQNQRNWSPFNHILRWVKNGNKHYINLAEFINEFPQFKITECTNFCTNGVSSVNREQFEGGRWVTKDMKKAREYATNVLRLQPYFDKYYTKAIFVRAMMKVMSSKKDFNFDEFLHKVKLRPNMLVPCGTVEQYVEMIEDIYNYKRKNKLNLRF